VQFHRNCDGTAAFEMHRREAAGILFAHIVVS